MKAILMTAAGGPEVLQATDLAIPELTSPHHLRVRLHAAGVNPVDTKLRKGGTYFPDKMPAVLGCDGAGAVVAVGDAVTRFKPGDEVYFFNGGIGDDQGNYAEYTVIHEAYAAAKPHNLSFIEAAAVPLVLITAWESLFDRTALQAGQSVLIHAGAGGVGHVAIQLAAHAGAWVATTVSGHDKAEFAKSLGAEEVIDYAKEDFVKAALAWTGGEGADVVFDTVGGETFCRSFAAAKVYGRVVTLLQSECTAPQIKVARSRCQSIHYELMLAPSALGMHEARVAQTHILEQGARLIEEGKLKVVVSKVLPLAQAAEAHRLIEEGHSTGKIVLSID